MLRTLLFALLSLAIGIVVPAFLLIGLLAAGSAASVTTPLGALILLLVLSAILAAGVALGYGISLRLPALYWLWGIFFGGPTVLFGLLSWTDPSAFAWISFGIVLAVAASVGGYRAKTISDAVGREISSQGRETAARQGCS